MIDAYNHNATGWARFSDDMLMRYRLGRAHTPLGCEYLRLHAGGLNAPGPKSLSPLPLSRYWTRAMLEPLVRVVFLMLNSSRADAFKPDPTIGECLKHSLRWHPDADVTEAVNMFAFISPYPEDLLAAANPGADAINDEAIMMACTGATRVIAAWGTGGELWGRATYVRGLLKDAKIPLYHMGLTKDGHPKHPLARGKHRILSSQMPIEWAASGGGASVPSTAPAASRRVRPPRRGSRTAATPGSALGARTAIPTSAGRAAVRWTAKSR